MAQSPGSSRSGKSQPASGDTSQGREKTGATGASGSSSGGGGPSPSADNPAPATVADVQEEAGKLVNATRAQATEQVASQKDRVASSLGVLAEALHQAGQQVREQDAAPLAGYVDAAADQVGQLAGILRDQDMRQLFETAQQFGRRQPGLFLAATFALGFAGVRFLKSGAGAHNQEMGSSATTWDSTTAGDESRSGSSWNDAGSAESVDGFGDARYAAEMASSGAGQSSASAMAPGTGRDHSLERSKSASGADTMLDSEPPTERAYDSGLEGR